jgi:hypothetical protein|tara:strand:- start:314 stop:556 length:243 start_codon:yes stop_codon:yes gene_type:complete
MINSLDLSPVEFSCYINRQDEILDAVAYNEGDHWTVETIDQSIQFKVYASFIASKFDACTFPTFRSPTCFWRPTVDEVAA